MKKEIFFQKDLGTGFLCQIGSVKGKELAGALSAIGVKLTKTPKDFSENFFFGLGYSEFFSLRALGGDTGEIFLRPLDQVSGSGFRVSESTFFTAIKKIHEARVSAAAAAKQKAVLADAEAAFSKLPVVERAKQEWDKSPDLRDEFSSLDAYTAYKKGIESGHIKIFSKGK